MSRHLLRFNKSERLTSKKIIGELFEKGKSDLVYPVKVVILETKNEDYSSVMAAFSVSKKNFRNAVTRNLLKRRMKEAYRLNKSEVLKNIKGKSYSIMFIYVAREILHYSNIEKSIKQILLKLS